MSRPLRGVLVVIAIVGALASGGCRGVVAAPTPAVASAGGSAAAPGSVPTAGTSGTDPLGSIESTLDAIEKQVDRDGAG